MGGGVDKRGCAQCSITQTGVQDLLKPSRLTIKGRFNRPPKRLKSCLPAKLDALVFIVTHNNRAQPRRVNTGPYLHPNIKVGT